MFLWDWTATEPGVTETSVYKRKKNSNYYGVTCCSSHPLPGGNISNVSAKNKGLSSLWVTNDYIGFPYRTQVSGYPQGCVLSSPSNRPPQGSLYPPEISTSLQPYRLSFPPWVFSGLYTHSLPLHVIKAELHTRDGYNGKILMWGSPSLPYFSVSGCKQSIEYTGIVLLAEGCSWTPQKGSRLALRAVIFDIPKNASFISRQEAGSSILVSCQLMLYAFKAGFTIPGPYL